MSGEDSLVCPDCLETIKVDRIGSIVLGSRCGCPEKHWDAQDQEWREQWRDRRENPYE